MKFLLSGFLALSLLGPSLALAEEPAPLAATCAPGAILRAVTFQVDRKIALGEDDEDEELSPYIELGAVAQSIAGLREPDVIVLPCREIVVVADYPLRDNFEFRLTAPTEAGFSRVELARQIGALYQRIYREEEESSSIAVTPLAERKGLINRNMTNGKYGIWGHDLSDLGLGSVTPEVRGGTVYVILSIDS